MTIDNCDIVDPSQNKSQTIMNQVELLCSKPDD